MKMRMTVKCVAAALLLAVTLPAAGENVQVPAKAAGEQTVVAVWVDLGQFTPETLKKSGEYMLSMLPASMDEMKPQLRERMMQQLEKMPTASREADVRGFLFGVNAPERPDAEPVGFMLVRVGPDATPEQVKAALAKDATNVPPDATIEPFEDSWLAVVSEQSPLPDGGDAEAAAALTRLLTSNGEPAISIAFRQTDHSRAMMQAEQGQAAMGAASQFLAAADTGTVAVRLGDTVSVDLALNYKDAEVAEQMRQAMAGSLVMLNMMAAGSLPPPQSGGPNPQDVQAVINQLQPKQADGTVKLTLGRELFEAIAKVAGPMFTAAPAPAPVQPQIQ